MFLQGLSYALQPDYIPEIDDIFISWERWIKKVARAPLLNGYTNGCETTACKVKPFGWKFHAACVMLLLDIQPSWISKQIIWPKNCLKNKHHIILLLSSRSWRLTGSNMAPYQTTRADRLYLYHFGTFYF